MKEIKDHHRVNDILLGPLERPALKWLAAHMPAWVTPDVCTAIGVFGALMTTLAYLFSRSNPDWLWVASLGFVVNWFGDSLDGTLARYRHIERPVFGFFLDHMVDAVIEMMIFLGLGMTRYVDLRIASLTLIAYLLMSVLAMTRTAVVGEFKISYGKLGPTEVRVLAILLNTGMFYGGLRSFSISLGTFGTINFSPYDLFVGAIALLLFYFFFVTTLKDMIRLSRVD